MLKTKDILDDKDKRLYQISKEVTFPLSKEDKENIKNHYPNLQKYNRCS